MTLRLALVKGCKLFSLNADIKRKESVYTFRLIKKVVKNNNKIVNLKEKNIMKKRIAVKKELLKQVITIQNTMAGIIIGVLFTVIIL